jgi:hypothetical protein
MAQIPNADNVAAAQGFANLVPLAPGQVPAVGQGPPPALLKILPKTLCLW